MRTLLGLTSILLISLFSCQEPSIDEVTTAKSANNATRLKLTLDHAEKLVQLPIKCIDIEYPNKLNQVIAGDADLKSPKKLHPAFYGCFDWHSAVHGHWSLVRLLKEQPNLAEKDRIIA